MVREVGGPAPSSQRSLPFIRFASSRLLGSPSQACPDRPAICPHFIAYLRYVRRNWSLGHYLTVWFVYLLGLMCKPMLVTLPIVLLLLDYWPLARWTGVSSGERGTGSGSKKSPRSTAHPPPFPSFGSLVIEKIPLVVLSLTSCALTISYRFRRYDRGETDHVADAGGQCVGELRRLFVSVFLARTGWRLLSPSGTRNWEPRPCYSPLGFWC